MKKEVVEERYKINWHEITDIEQLVTILSVGINGLIISKPTASTKAIIKKLKKENLIKDYETNPTK